MASNTDLPCPACHAATIGTSKSQCRTCNRYVSRVRREVARALAVTVPPDLLAHVRQQARASVYAAMFPTSQSAAPASPERADR